jgi:hypothetical protein
VARREFIPRHPTIANRRQLWATSPPDPLNFQTMFLAIPMHKRQNQRPDYLRITQEIQLEPALQTATDSIGSQSEPALSRKQDLEIEKLNLEIAELRRSAWFKPAVMIPILATLVTIGISWRLGVFDVERKRLENSAKELEMHRERLQTEVDQLQKDRQDLEGTKAGLRKQIGDLDKQLKLTRGNYQKTLKQLSYTQNILSKPVFNLSYYSAFDHAHLKLLNEGKGTGRIQIFRVYVDGKWIPAGSFKHEWSPALSALGIDHTWIRWYWPGDDALNSGSSLSLIEIPDEDLSPSKVEMLDKAHERLGLEICYCSNIGQCEWATLNRPAIKGSCKNLENKK